MKCGPALTNKLLVTMVAFSINRMIQVCISSMNVVQIFNFNCRHKWWYKMWYFFVSKKKKRNKNSRNIRWQHMFLLRWCLHLSAPPPSAILAGNCTVNPLPYRRHLMFGQLGAKEQKIARNCWNLFLGTRTQNLLSHKVPQKRSLCSKREVSAQDF